MDALGQLDQQIETLLGKEYPALAGLTESAFLGLVEPLRARVAELSAGGDQGRVPFVLVVPSRLVPTEAAMARVELRGKAGMTRLEPVPAERFVPRPEVEIPSGGIYLVLDVDTGPDTLNVTPDDALPRIAVAGRSPLTIDEGVALLTHHPELLRTRNCFSILGSRCGDKRVPALWVSGGHPRLGWCWAGNPHTWLGSASCAGRVDASGRAAGPKPLAAVSG